MLKKFLGWLQERIKHWTKPVSSALIIGTLLDLTRNRTDLVVENALYRRIKGAQFTNLDRFWLVVLSLFTNDLADVNGAF